MKIIFVKQCNCVACYLMSLQAPAYMKAMSEAMDKMIMGPLKRKERKMPGKIIEYRHHGILVKADEELAGKHRDHCLCFRNCARFKPEEREKNCHIANVLFAVDRAFGLVTPVYECSLYLRQH